MRARAGVPARVRGHLDVEAVVDAIRAGSARGDPRANARGPEPLRDSGDALRAAGALAFSLALHGAAAAALVVLAGSARVDLRPVTAVHVIPIEVVAAPAATPAIAPETPLVRAAAPEPEPPKARPFARPLRRAVEPAPVSAPPPVVAEVASAETSVAAPPPVAVALVPGPAPAPLAALRGGYQRRPRYPHGARLRGVEGTTLLRVWVAPSGSVGTVEVERSAGDGDLDHAAADAVRDWRFEPLHASQDPSGLWVLVPVEFHLR